MIDDLIKSAIIFYPRLIYDRKLDQNTSFNNSNKMSTYMAWASVHGSWTHVLYITDYLPNAKGKISKSPGTRHKKYFEPKNTFYKYNFWIKRTLYMNNLIDFPYIPPLHAS